MRSYDTHTHTPLSNLEPRPDLGDRSGREGCIHWQAELGVTFHLWPLASISKNWPVQLGDLYARYLWLSTISQAGLSVCCVIWELLLPSLSLKFLFWQTMTYVLSFFLALIPQGCDSRSSLCAVFLAPRTVSGTQEVLSKQCLVLEYFLFCVNRYRPCLPCMTFSTSKISEPCFLLSQMGMLFFGYHQFANYFIILSPAHLLRPSSLWIMALGSHFYFLLCHPTRLALSQPHPLFPSSGKPLATDLHLFPIMCSPHSPYSLTEERQIWKEWWN